jgi:O-antigen ligase
MSAFLCVVNSYSELRALFDRAAYQPQPGVAFSRVGIWAFGLYLADIVFMIRGYAVSNLVETLLFLTFLVNGPLRREFVKTLKDPVVASLMLFFGWALIAGTWSSATWLAVLDDWWDWRKLLLLPIGLVLMSSMKRVMAAIYTLAIMGLIYVIVALVDLWGFGQLWHRSYHNVVQDANVQGIYFSLVGLTCLLVGWINRDKRVIALALAMTSVVYFLFVAWFGISRSGYVAFIIALGLAGVFLIRGHRVSGLLVGVLVAALVLWQSPTVKQRIQQATSEIAVGAADWGGTHTSGSIRFVMWANTLKMITNAPVLGSGAGDFKKSYAEVVTGQTGWRATLTDDPHNQYLHIWAEYGIVGLFTFFGFLSAVFLRVHWQRPDGILLACTLLVSAAISMFNGVYGGSAMGRLVIINLTIYLAMGYHWRTETMLMLMSRVEADSAQR